MTYHWAYNEDGEPEIVEKVANGKVLCMGVEGPVTPNGLFVHIDDEPIPAPKIDWTADMKPEAVGCDDCPPHGYPTANTRCDDCPRREQPKS